MFDDLPEENRIRAQIQADIALYIRKQRANLSLDQEQFADFLRIPLDLLIFLESGLSD